LCGRPGGPPLIMVHQIDPFREPQLADTGCLEADQNGGLARSAVLGVALAGDSLAGTPRRTGLRCPRRVRSVGGYLAL